LEIIGSEMRNKILVLLLGLFFIGSAAAELGGHCVDNVLFWNEIRTGVSRNRDCSVIRTGAGVQVMGECRIYGGGAACFGLNGTVTHKYIMEARERYEAIINPKVTTTTLQQTIINLECPACPECPKGDSCDGYSGMRIDFLAMNKTLETCVKNRDYYRKEYEARIEKSSYDNMVIEKDLVNSETKRVLGECDANLSYAKEWSDYYLYFSVFCFIGICFLIVVWIKKPSWEDPEVDLGKI